MRMKRIRVTIGPMVPAYEDMTLCTVEVEVEGEKIFKSQQASPAEDFKSMFRRMLDGCAPWSPQ
jgi:hypothetical protein